MMTLSLSRLPCDARPALQLRPFPAVGSTERRAPTLTQQDLVPPPGFQASGNAPHFFISPSRTGFLHQ
jgi:hypothetical protein